MPLAETWREAVRRELDVAVALRHELHQEPRVSGDESDTAERITTTIGAGPGRVVAGTGRLVELSGEDLSRAVVLRTELDGLPVTERTTAPWASRNGAMHACGHDVHMAALVAVCRAAAHVRLPLPLAALLQPRQHLSGGPSSRVAGCVFSRTRVRVGGRGVGPHCSFCGSSTGPFSEVKALFTVLICIPCLEVRQARSDTLLGLHDPAQPWEQWDCPIE